MIIRRVIITLLLIIAASIGSINSHLVPGAYACMDEQFGSVHFHPNPIDFGVPPRRAIIGWRGEHDDRPIFINDKNEDYISKTDTELNWYNDTAITDAHNRELNNLGIQAGIHVQHRSWDKAAVTYRRMAKIIGWTGSLIDRMQVIREESPIKTQAKAVQLYLHALALDDAGYRSEAYNILSNLASHQYGNHLIEHCWYQLGAIAYEREQNSEAIHCFQKLLNKYPNTCKRQAALLMITRCYLFPSNRRTADNFNELVKIPSDLYITNGAIYLKKLIASHPPVRFNRVIKGLEARLFFIKRHLTKAVYLYQALGDTASIEAVLSVFNKSPRIDHSSLNESYLRAWLLSQYLLHLASAVDYLQYSTALSDMDRTKATMTTQDAHQFKLLLYKRKEIVAPYLYYRLYHVSNSSNTLPSIAILADRLITYYGKKHLPQAITVRIAEIHYVSGNYRKAFTWAEGALNQGCNDRALYVRGAASGKLKHYQSAIREFLILLKRYPKSQLAHGAREELTILYEQTGELDKALEQYYILGYKLDVAYLLDVKMSKPQISQYFKDHNDEHIHWQVAFALGIRHLRDEEWMSAIKWFKSIPRKVYAKLSKHPEYQFDYKSGTDKITAASNLRQLQRNIRLAYSQTARADALYRYATCFYKQGTLLFYNHNLWDGNRAYHFGYFWSSSQPTFDDNRLIPSYMYQHEVYARCLTICRMIAKKYPHTPAVPKAIYRAACCASRLSGLNSWWRKQPDSNKLSEEASQWMIKLYTHYPHHPLAAHAKKYAVVFKWANHLY